MHQTGTAAGFGDLYHLPVLPINFEDLTILDVFCCAKHIMKMSCFFGFFLKYII